MGPAETMVESSDFSDEEVQAVLAGIWEDFNLGSGNGGGDDGGGDNGGGNNGGDSSRWKCTPK
jgi:hypothetical protein